jgi:hypothetical protein
MPIKLENVGIAVRDLEATIAFFTDLGLTILARDTLSGEWTDTAVRPTATLGCLILIAAGALAALTVAANSTISASDCLVHPRRVTCIRRSRARLATCRWTRGD